MPSEPVPGSSRIPALPGTLSTIPNLARRYITLLPYPSTERNTTDWPVMPLIDLPPGVAELLARWQAAQGPQDINDNLVNDTRTLLSALVSAQDQQPAMDTHRMEAREASRLKQELAHAKEQVENLTDEVENGEAAIALLRSELTQSRTISEALARKTPISVQGPRYDKIPDPERFDGTRSKLSPFITQLQLKTATYPDEQSKLRLAINCLTGDALHQVQSYVRNGTVDLETLADLITILDTAFGNPNRLAEAEAKLATIQQDGRDFSSYYAEFQRYAIDVNWDESSRLAALKRGLAYRLKNDLVTITEEPRTFVDFATLCNRLDMRRRALQSESQSSRPIAARPPPRTTPPMRTPPATVASGPSTQSGTHPGPMDLSANRRRLSPEERARRMSEGRCYRCGGLGHLSRDCVLSHRRSPATPIHAAEASTTPLPPNDEEFEPLN